MESLGKITKSGTRLSSRQKKDPHLHSPAHLLADEISVKLNDRKHFALYLGLAEHLDHQLLRSVMGQVLESKNVKSPGKLFAFLVKKKRQEPK